MHTQIRIPPNACCTQAMCENASITPASKEIITTDGKATPSVATIPPRIPANFCPIKVATFTAMIPGVHCPSAN